MADRKPIKVLPDGGGDSAGLAEFVAADTIGVVDGGTGLATVATSNILTGNGTSALSAESNLTFDGSTLTVLGNAGVGIARTEGTLHVHTATAGSVTAATNADELVVENSAAGGISILPPDANDGILKFGSPTLDYNGSISVNHNSNAPYMDFNVDSARRMRLTDTGRLGIGVASPAQVLDVNGSAHVANILYANDSANGQMTVGATFNQGSNDNHIFTCKSTDIAHGITSGGYHASETDDFFLLKKKHGDYGGAALVALAEDAALTTVMQFEASGGTADTAKTSSAVGMFNFHAAEQSGGDVQPVTGNGNVFAIGARVAGPAERALFLVDEDGDVHYDGSTNATAWDDEDDIGLLSTFRNLTTGKKAQHVFGEFVQENAQVLHDSGVITMNDDGHHFVSTKGLNALIIDTIRQEGQKWRTVIGDYKDKIAALESRLMRLEN